MAIERSHRTEKIMKKTACSLIILSLAAWSSIFAIASKEAPLGKTVVVPDGTEIAAVTTETLSSKTAHEDDPITFKVDEDVVVDGSVVIARGALIKGIVTNAKKSGYFGRGGELNVRVESTETVDKQKVKVRASKGRSGNDKTGATVALVVLFGPIGFLKKGKNAEIKEGTRIKVFTDEEKKVDVPMIP